MASFATTPLIFPIFARGRVFFFAIAALNARLAATDYIKRFALRPRRRRVGRSERRTELLLGDKSISARERQQGLAGRPSI